MSIPTTNHAKPPAAAIRPRRIGNGRIADDQWQTRAACKNADPEWFFQTTPDDPRTLAALGFCALGTDRQCPVLAECRAFAWENGAQGVWAGRYRPVLDTIRSTRPALRRAAGKG